MAAIASSGVPATPLRRNSAGSRPIAPARSHDLDLVGAHAHHLRRRVDQLIGVAARVAAGAAHALEGRAGVVRRTERHVVLVREAGGQARRARRAGAPDDDRRVRLLHGLGQRGRVGERVVRALVAEGLAGGRVPEARHDLELLLEPVEPLTQ